MSSHGLDAFSPLAADARWALRPTDRSRRGSATLHARAGDVAFARQHRRQHNRLGFAVQLALVHDLGRLLRVDEHLPVAIIDVVAEQLGVEPGVFDLYARRDETRREHASEIVLHLKLRTIRQADYRVAITAGAAAAVGTERGEPIVRAIIDELKVRPIMVPPAALVERFALAGRA